MPHTVPHSRLLSRARGSGIQRVSPWLNAGSVGLSALDFDHQILQIALGVLENEISYVARDHALDKVIAFLIHYSDEHFTREEHLLEQLGYHGLASHKESHDIMRAWMDASLPEIGAMRNPHYDDDVIAYLYDWWSGHSQKDDSAYAEFIKLRMSEANRIADSLPRSDLPKFLMA